ncbi:hypothetical protein CVT24_005361 [Panaeolus cyanescens]|uniref:Uncharacterized protein n=1 Tax=Panaeolus cyanescens TaxID=181874 RepID=A0A409Y9P1_9AGAR|nr:hypothetical protein CVT24_005361 [Panaeolus cyanescens]
MLSWMSNTQPGTSGDEDQGTLNPPSRSPTRSPRNSLSPTFASPYHYAGQQTYAQEGAAYSTGVQSRPLAGEAPPNVKPSKKEREKGKEKEKTKEPGPFDTLTTPHDAYIAELFGDNAAPTAALQRASSFGASDRKVSADQESLAWDTAPAISTSLSGSRNDLVPPPTGVMSSAASQFSSTTAGTARLATPIDLLIDPYDGNVLGSLIPHVSDNEHDDDMHTMAMAGTGAPGARAPSELVWSHLSKVLELQNDISRLHMRMESIGTGKDASGTTKKAGRKGHHRTPSSRTTAKDDVERDADSLKTPGGTEKIPLSVDTPTLARSMGFKGKDKDPYSASLPSGMRRQRGMSTVSDLSEHSSDADDVANVGVPMDDSGLDMPTEEEQKKRLREEEFAKLASQFEGRKEAIHEIMGKVDALSKAITDFHKLHFGFSNVQQSSLGTAPPISESLSDTTHLKSSTSKLSDPVPLTGVSGFKVSPDRPLSVPKTAPAHIQINPMAMGRARSDGAAMGTPVLPPVPFSMPKPVDGEAVQRSTTLPQAQAQTEQAQDEQSQSRDVRERKKTVPMLLMNSLELDTDLARQEHLMDSPASTLGSLKLPAED